MDKQELMKSCAKDEDKILVAKLLDKIKFTSQKNQIQVTDFLDGYEQKLSAQVLQQAKYKTYKFYGGYEESERKILFFLPDKLFDLIHEPLETNKMIQNEIEVISIVLPNDLVGKYHHRDYLRNNGADIVVQKDISEYLLSSLQELTRFRKSNIYIKKLPELEVVTLKFETMTILVPQLRLDTIISEVLHTSRTKANEIIASERVLVNYETKTKNSILLQKDDLLTIRGKGKYKIGDIIYQTSKGKLRVEVNKYIS